MVEMVEAKLQGCGHHRYCYRHHFSKCSNKVGRVGVETGITLWKPLRSFVVKNRMHF